MGSNLATIKTYHLCGRSQTEDKVVLRTQFSKPLFYVAGSRSPPSLTKMAEAYIDKMNNM